ncbi:MAG: protein arginine kinase [Firmicutes bacterium]|nr:protein arginine kinase [Bacillota bacterium]
MSLREIINRPVSEWMRGSGPDRDVVLGSRIRLARNLAGIPFPAVASEQQLEHVMTMCREAVAKAGSLGNMEFVPMSSLTPLERQLLVERHLISPQHTKAVRHKAVILRDDEVVSVMINEEDHIRIQVLMPGMQLGLALDVADRVDNGLEGQLPYAFSETRGYLTACPTNVGTGLRASLMVHLPALALTDQIGRIIGAVGKFGLVVRGLYGEGTQAVGNIFQFSNQVTLGRGERETVEHLISVTRQVIDQEREARQAILKRNETWLEDRVLRAYGTLAHARVLSSREAMQLLSDVRLGIDLGLITDLKPEILQELLVLIRPAHLQNRVGRELGPAERDQLRASLVRERIRAFQAEQE